MTIDDFIGKHNIQIDNETYLACKCGIEIMRNSIDPHHNEEHVNKIFDNLSYLLDSVPNLVTHIDFGVLLPAICWHDTWISRHQAENIFHLGYLQIVEGRKSAKMWLDYSKDKLNKVQVNMTHYCIRKHSSLQIIPRYTLEAKILIDLDKLEVWNIYRFLNKKKTLVSQKKLYGKYIVRFYYQYSWYAGLYFRELETRLNILKDSFWNELK